MSKIIHLDRLADTVLTPLQKDTVEVFLPSLEDAVVRKGLHVTQEQALSWLEKATTVISPAEINRAIRHLGTFSEEDIRALWAFDSNEYYAPYAASEVYAVHRLQAINVPDAIHKDQRVVNEVSLAGVMESQGYSRPVRLTDHLAANNCPLSPNEPWMRIEDIYVSSKDGEEYLVSCDTQKTQSFTQGDDIRMHYAKITAYFAGMRPHASYHIKIGLDEALKTSLPLMVKHNPHGKGMLIETVKSMAEEGKALRLEMHNVETKANLVKGIMEAGRNHSRNLIRGFTPDFNSKKTSKGEMPSHLQSQSLELSKTYAAAQRLKVHSQAAFEAARQSLSEFYERNEIGEVASPYPLVEVGPNKKFDLEGAGSWLIARGVNRESLVNMQADVAGLANAAKAAGLDVSPYFTPGEFEKHKVVSMLEEYGQSESEFKQPGTHAHFIGQTRGKMKDVITALDDEVAPAVDRLISEMGQSERFQLTVEERGNEPGQHGPGKGEDTPENDDMTLGM